MCIFFVLCCGSELDTGNGIIVFICFLFKEKTDVCIDFDAVHDDISRKKTLISVFVYD